MADWIVMPTEFASAERIEVRRAATEARRRNRVRFEIPKRSPKCLSTRCKYQTGTTQSPLTPPARKPRAKPNALSALAAESTVYFYNLRVWIGVAENISADLRVLYFIVAVAKGPILEIGSLIARSTCVMTYAI